MAEGRGRRIRFTKLQVALFAATLLASFLPWALKPVAIMLAYAAVLQHQSLRHLQQMILTSRFLWLTIAYWAALMLSAILNGSNVAEGLRVTIPILMVPLFVVIGALPEKTQRELLSALVAAAFVYTTRYAVTFDWSQIGNAEYRGDADTDVFVALNGAFICVFAIERLLLSRPSLLFSYLLGALAVYSFLIVLIIKSRGTLAAILVTVLLLCARYLLSKSADKAIHFAIFFLCAAFVIVSTTNLTTVFESISDLLHLTDEGTRSLATGSGRLFVWDYAVFELWPERFWLGYGPNANFQLAYDAFRIHGAHNLVIAAVVDGGLLAALPILAILILPLLLFRRNGNPVVGYQFYFISLAAALNENLLFTYGSPFAWAALAMFAQINGSSRKVFTC
jgi:O-antigen ligase